MLTDHEIETPCPYCGRRNELHGNTYGETRAPEPGDISVCWQCYSPAVFDLADRLNPRSLILRRPSNDEMAEIQPIYRRIRAAMQEAYTPHEALRLTSEHGGTPEH